MILPVDFEGLVKTRGIPSGGGYPYQIRATDLMKNFVHASLEADPSIIEPIIGQGGHVGRRLKIPAAPGSGTHVLGVVDGVLQWVATEEC